MNKTMFNRLVVLLLPIVVVGCAIDFTRESSESLCVDYMTSGPASIFRSSIRNELDRRGVNCNAYAGTVNAVRQSAAARASSNAGSGSGGQQQEMFGVYSGAQSGGGVTATWTGRSVYGSSVTGQSVVTCEYTYAGQNIRRTFQGSCPSSIQVQ